MKSDMDFQHTKLIKSRTALAWHLLPYLYPSVPLAFFFSYLCSEEAYLGREEIKNRLAFPKICTKEWILMLRDVSGYWMEKFHSQINFGNPELIKVKPVLSLWAFNNSCELWIPKREDNMYNICQTYLIINFFFWRTLIWEPHSFIL